jgi:predicted acylesterase/phospholipase RssA
MNKYIFCIIKIAFFILFTKSSITQDRPKIGLVLSGGGARGFAHIAVLKMLDSLEIPVDVIAGTSMGGIAGALYAIGTSGVELEHLSFRTDWLEIFTDQSPRKLMPFFQKRETGRYQVEFGISGLLPNAPSGLIFGQKVSLLFSGLTFPYERVNDFDRLPCPFRCMAVDLVTGNPVVLGRGSLSKAMRATMAIPTIFSPVEYGDSLLIDGGVLNNLPVDVVRSMGAEIVIAVDVGPTLLARKELNTAFDVLEQSIAMLGRDRWKENVRNADILITPDLAGFTMADFENRKIERIVGQGEKAARASLGELVALKEKYGLRRLEDPQDISRLPEKPQIIDVSITGYTSLPFQYIYEQVGLLPGDLFDPQGLRSRISELKADRIFEEVHYEVIPLSEGFVRLLIRVREKEKPVIHRVSIRGASPSNLPVAQRLLGLGPGDSLDTEILGERIMKLYGMGYYENIRYDITSSEKNQVDLTLTVKELPQKKLRLGIRYDDYHNLVLAASLLVTNPVVQGLRVENEVQFAGLTRFQGKIFYPSKTLSLPAYPFVRLLYRNVPTRLFAGREHCIAEYKDRSLSAGLGFGLLDARFFNLEVEVQYEWMRATPDVALADPLLFPEWRDRLRKLNAAFTIDLLDGVLAPKEGFLMQGCYEAGFKKWGSDAAFQRLDVSLDAYHTWHHRHTLRAYGNWCGSDSGTPPYKFFNQGRPQFFVGMRYDQLLGSGMSVLRMDYRYEYAKTLFFKGMANVALDYRYRFQGATYHADRLWGIGCGIQFVFMNFGSVEMGYGYGSRCVMDPDRGQSVGFFSLGAKF